MSSAGNDEPPAPPPLEGPSKGRSRSAARWLLRMLRLIGVNVAVGVVLLEGGLRLAGLDPGRVWEPDPELGWRHVPGERRRWREEGDALVVINSEGRRDRERPAEKPADVYRIGFFGDSMTEGVQVDLEQTFAYRLEERLRGRTSRPVEVLNFGVNGYGPAQEYLLFRREGPRHRPDLVVVGVFADNDVADSAPELRSGEGWCPFPVLDGEKLAFDFSRAEQSFADYHREPFYSLRKRSAIYRVASEWRGRRRTLAAAAPPDGRQAGAGPQGDPTWVPKRYRLYRKPLSPEWERAWTATERVLEEFAAEAGRQQARFAIISLPAGQVVQSHAWATLVRTYPAMGQGEWDLEGPNRRLEAFALERGYPLLRTQAAFREAASSSGPPLFFGDIGHLTPRGHEVMADLLERFVRDHDLVPGLGGPVRGGDAGR